MPASVNVHVSHLTGCWTQTRNAGIIVRWLTTVPQLLKVKNLWFQQALREVFNNKWPDGEALRADNKRDMRNANIAT